MKRKEIVILLAYSIPWGFLGLWADQLSLFGLAMGITGFLAWLCSKAGKLGLLLTGNGLSAVLTLALLCWAYFSGAWNFELFGPFGWTVFALALTIPVQAFTWNRYWWLLAAYVALVVGAVLCLYGLMLGL